MQHPQVDEILKDIPGTSGVTKQIKVLRLPTKHCFFNPIELVWAYIKGYVARRNHTCKLKESERLTKEAITMVIEVFVCLIRHYALGIMPYLRDDLVSRTEIFKTTILSC